MEACSARRRAQFWWPWRADCQLPDGRVGGLVLIKPNQADIRWIYLYTDS